jgi:hypothetical protein
MHFGTRCFFQDEYIIKNTLLLRNKASRCVNTSVVTGNLG